MLDGLPRLEQAKRALLAAIDEHGGEFRSFVALAVAIRQEAVYPDDLVQIIDGYYKTDAYDTAPHALTEAYQRYKTAYKLSSQGRSEGNGPGF